MNGNMSIIQLLLQASLLVKVILALLAAASVLSWTVILAKRSLLSRTEKAAAAFENRFWSGGTLGDLYENLRRGRDKSDEGLPQVFCAGYEEFTRQQGSRVDPDDALAAVQRQMRVTQTREIERLEGGLSMLATIGSTSPYVGLFGTVWGIMTAFIAIGNVKQATLASVAPGIAEALIATAFGLFAAIPAVIAYNFFTSRLDRIETRFGTFAEEMTGIIERGLRGASGSRAA
ncbi:protein TolQ, partial [Nevskia soli]|uniref:protein TolQ n=1 Tax=Nevskia soli TaxID=418856 RepID=UPI0004A6BE1F